MSGEIAITLVFVTSIFLFVCSVSWLIIDLLENVKKEEE